MGTLNAKLVLTSNDLTSDAINMTITDLITVEKNVELKRIIISTTATNIVAGGLYTKSFVYVKNVDSAITINLVKSEGGDHYMTLAPGEFGFFPWATLVDLAADAASGTPVLEVGIFEQ